MNYRFIIIRKLICPFDFKIYKKHIMQSQLHNTAKDTSDITQKEKLAFVFCRVVCPRGNPS